MASHPLRNRLAAAGLTVGLGLQVLSMAPAGAVVSGTTEGCTPGYWKNHTESWEEHTPTQTLQGLGFQIPDSLASFRDVTLLQALQGGGGPGLEGAAKILFRAATAAYLNAAHEGLEFPYRRFTDDGIRNQVRAALASGDRDVMLDLAAELDAANNLGCPLS